MSIFYDIYPIFERVSDYEAGILDEAECVALFQHILDNRLYQHLQGHYGRMCQTLLDEGLIFLRVEAGGGQHDR